MLTDDKKKLLNLKIEKLIKNDFSKFVIRNNKALFILSVIGLSIGLIDHFSVILGYHLFKNTPLIFIFEILMFFLWIPAVIVIINNHYEYNKFNLTSLSAFNFFKAVFYNLPISVLVLSILSILYGLIYFSFSLSDIQGVPGIINGEYVLHHYETIYKKISEEEYYKLVDLMILRTSAFVVFFYGFYIGVFYPKKVKKE